MNKKLEWLEAMRGFAALWVLLHHAHLAARDFAGMPEHQWQWLANGYLGVDFFFVLSGFIIAFSSQRLVEQGKGLREYASARAIRIYVPYLPVGVGMFILYLVLPGLSAGHREPASLLTSLTLLPATAPPALSVAWTLVHEMLFYALFSLFFLAPRALAGVMAAWVLSIAAVWVRGAPLSSFADYFLSPLNLCFVLGVLLAWVTRKGMPDRLALVAAPVGVALVASQAVAIAPSRTLVALGFAALVAASRAQFINARSPGRVLLALGAASYSIYLVHNPSISVAVRGLSTLHDPALVFFAVAALGLVPGLAYHWGYERPMLRQVRGLLVPRARTERVPDLNSTVAPLKTPPMA